MSKPTLGEQKTQWERSFLASSCFKKDIYTFIYFSIYQVLLQIVLFLSENGAKKVTGKSRSFHSVALSEYACKHFDDGGEGLADFRGL